MSSHAALTDARCLWRERGRWWIAALLIVVALPLAAPTPAAAARVIQTLNGVVADVKDGDGLFVQDRVGQLFEIRLSGIDAPEMRQPFGRDAASAMRALAAGQRVTVHIVKMDRFGRHVGKVVRDDGIDLGLTLVQQGLAWWFKAFARDQLPADRESYAQAERTARAARIGLWIQPNPEPPWEFRARRNGRAAVGNGQH